MSDLNAELREAVRLLRGLLPKSRGGHTSFCCGQNGGRHTTEKIQLERCVCHPQNRDALAFLHKHGARL